MHDRPCQQRTLSGGAASVAASWIIFAGLAALAFLLTTLDPAALAALAFAGFNAAAWACNRMLTSHRARRARRY